MRERLAALSGALLVIGAALMAPTASAAPPPVVVSVVSLAQLPTPLPYPYDPAADARAQVAQAQARAASAGKLLLIDLGGNWCADCRILAAVMNLPEVAAFLNAHYEVVSVDVGHMDRNLDIPARWGVKRMVAVPSLLVIDPRGRLRNAGRQEALADARAMSPQALATWLASWTP